MGLGVLDLGFEVWALGVLGSRVLWVWGSRVLRVRVVGI